MDRGTYSDSWTWFDARIGTAWNESFHLPIKDGTWNIAKNSRESDEWQEHVIEFDENHDMVAHMEAGDCVVLCAHAICVLYRTPSS